MAFGKKKTKKDDDPLAQFRNTSFGGGQESTKSDHGTVLAHEEEAAALFGGRRHRGSGASPFLKSDASSEEYQIECKQTAAEQLGLSWEWIKKITFEAIGMGKIPSVHIRFLRNKEGVEQDWVLIPASDFKRLRER